MLIRYAVYDASTGELRSTGAGSPAELPEGLDVALYPNGVDPDAVTWDAATRTFVTRPPALVRAFTPWGFRKRFTFEERVAIDEAAVTVPAVRTILEDMRAAGAIELDDPDVQQALDALVTMGLLTATRAAAILTPDEVGP